MLDETGFIFIRMPLCHDASLVERIVGLCVFDGYDKTSTGDVRVFWNVFTADNIPCTFAKETLDLFLFSRGETGSEERPSLYGMTSVIKISGREVGEGGGCVGGALERKPARCRWKRSVEDSSLKKEEGTTWAKL